MQRLAILMPAAGALLLAAPQAAGQPTQRISISSTGIEADADSTVPMISADGRFVAFSSSASNLVDGDTNGVPDAFVHDRLTGSTRRVSVDSAGAEGNDTSGAGAISADGRFVAFSSEATNLVPGDTNGVRDVFVHDRQTRTTERVSLSDSGAEADSGCTSPSISGDGRFVVFNSPATNLGPGDTNQAYDIFVRDRQTNRTSRVSVDSAGAEANGNSVKGTISAGGRYVALLSAASNLVPGDRNTGWDVFVHDRETRATTRVSVSSAGEQANDTSHHPRISADGRYVVFNSLATNLVPGDTNRVEDLFLHDRQTAETTRLSVDSSGAESDGRSVGGSMSADSRFVAFQSAATNLVPGDTNGHLDVFLRDRLFGTTSRLSLSSSGHEGTAYSAVAALQSISGDGRYVCFYSKAANLVEGDTNEVLDVFVRDTVHLQFNGAPRPGAAVSFTVANAMGEAGSTALVLLSCSGRLPGFSLPAGDGRTVYVNPDACTSLGLSLGALLQANVDQAGTASTPTVPFPRVGPGISFDAAAVTFESGQFGALVSPVSVVTE